MMESTEIKLRAPEVSDADFMFEVENDRDAWVYGDTVAPLSRRQLRDYAMDYDADPFRTGQLRLIITNGKGKPMGISDLYDVSQRHQRAFCAIYVLPSFRNKGIATAALRRMVDYCRDILFLNRLFSYISEENHISVRVFEKAGFHKQAILDEWIKSRDGFTSVILMTLKL